MVAVNKILTTLFGSRNERLLKRYHRIVEQVNAMEEKVQAYSDVQMTQRTQELRTNLVAGKLQAMDVLPEAFAIIRESMDRNIGIRAIFDPENKFDPEKLDDEMLEAYDSVQRQMISSGASACTMLSSSGSSGCSPDSFFSWIRMYG